jgi:hypothetical protein
VRPTSFFAPSILGDRSLSGYYWWLITLNGTYGDSVKE